jgi:hypothetical protein
LKSGANPSEGELHLKIYVDLVLCLISGRIYKQVILCTCRGNIQEEERMFQVSEKATEMLKEYFKDRETLPTIRIYLAPGG